MRWPFQQACEARHGLLVTTLDIARLLSSQMSMHTVGSITVDGTGSGPFERVFRLPAGFHSSAIIDAQASSSSVISGADARVAVSSDGVR